MLRPVLAKDPAGRPALPYGKARADMLLTRSAMVTREAGAYKVCDIQTAFLPGMGRGPVVTHASF